MRAPDWRWGFEMRRPHPFNEARTPGSRQGDSSLAHWWALEMAEAARRRVAMVALEPAGRQVAGHGAGLGRQGCEADLGAPPVEEPPLGPVDATGVLGDHRLQG